MDAKEQFEQKKEELKAKGFEPMMLHVTGWDAPTEIPAIPMSQMWEVGSDVHAGAFSMARNNATDAVPDCGTQNLGAAYWGSMNDMPQRIDSLINALPYTAQGIAYLHDMVMGMGPSLMWHTAIYNETTGKVEDVIMPYQQAGIWLRGRMASMKEKASSDASLDTEAIDELQEQYDHWKTAVKGIDDFLQNNDVLDWLDRLVTDYVKLGMCFPTLLLSLGRYRDERGNIIPWEPTIKRIDSIQSVVGRLEERDKNLRINYVYHCEKWRYTNEKEVNRNDAVAYPTLWPKNFLPKYRKMVGDARESLPKKRPTQFCAPISFCDNTSGYYPWMPWWSIFTSKAYYMAVSYLNDKAIARNNNNSWGKMVFINNEYLRALYAEAGADSAQEKQAIRKQVWDNFNNFLKNKENNQKTICLDSIIAPDGKTMMNAIEVVDVPGLSESSDMKEALEEITSTIFFGLGVKSGLIGDIPGKTTSNSGTYQRELTLLKQNQMAPVQQKFLRLLDMISIVNGWNSGENGSHFCWCIKQQVLTTLDRNPEGTEEKLAF